MSACREASVLLQLGEELEVKQLAAGHHEVAKGQGDSEMRGLHDHLEEEAGGELTSGLEEVRHVGAHDGAGQLSTRVQGHDSTSRTPSDAGEVVAHPGFGQVQEVSRGAATEVVDPVVGV